MDIGYCKYCEKIIDKKYGDFCNQCVKLMNSNLAKAKKELYKNPNITFNELVEKEGINAEIILLLMRQGRLIWKSLDALTCVICGASISQGSLCGACHASMTDSIRHCRDSSNNKEGFDVDKKQYIRDNSEKKNKREIHVSGIVDKLNEGS